MPKSYMPYNFSRFTKSLISEDACNIYVYLVFTFLQQGHLQARNHKQIGIIAYEVNICKQVKLSISSFRVKIDTL